MLTSIDDKFIFDSARLGLFSSADILQIANIALRVVFLLFWPCFSYFLSYFLLLKRVKCPPFFVFTTKTTQPRPHCLKVSLFFPFQAIISESLGRVFFFDSLLSSNTVLIFLLYYTRLHMKSPSFDTLEKLIF